MKPIESTAEILAFKTMGYPVDKRWVDWAYDMLVAGFDTENLVLLAGELEPYDQIELSIITDKLFTELGLAWGDSERVLKNYSCYLVGKAIDGKTKPTTVLKILKNIYLNDESSLSDFAMLYWANQDLEYGEEQYYWDGATRENIDEITMEYFRKWRSECLGG